MAAEDLRGFFTDDGSEEEEDDIQRRRKVYKIGGALKAGIIKFMNSKRAFVHSFCLPGAGGVRTPQPITIYLYC